MLFDLMKHQLYWVIGRVQQEFGGQKRRDITKVSLKLNKKKKPVNLYFRAIFLMTKKV